MAPYFDETPYHADHFAKWALAGDCIVSTCPKAGTYLIHNIIHLLKTGGDEDWQGSMFDFIGTTENVAYPGQTLTERIAETAAKRSFDSSRQTGLTHFSHKSPGPGLVGLDARAQPHVKYIVVMRNPREVVQSLLPFINGHSERFRELWGGFPNPLPSPEAALTMVVKVKGIIFGHASAWWEVRDQPNVLLVHFSDLVSKKAEMVLSIARFLEIEVSDKLLKTVVHKSSFEYMKAKEESHPEHYAMQYGHPGDRFNFLGKSKHMREGRSDGGRAFFTPEMNEQYEAAKAQYWGGIPGLAEWMECGGALHPAADSVRS